MQIIRIKPEPQHCLGVYCHKHGSCALYANLEGAINSNPIGTCVLPDGSRPRYRPVSLLAAPAAAFTSAPASAAGAVFSRDEAVA